MGFRRASNYSFPFLLFASGGSHASAISSDYEACITLGVIEWALDRVSSLLNKLLSVVITMKPECDFQPYRFLLECLCTIHTKGSYPLRDP
jgi:hypothetical protein